MILNPASELLKRSIGQLTGKVLIANPEDDFSAFLTFQTNADVYTWCQSRTIFDTLLNNDVSEKKLAFSASLPTFFPTDFDHIVLYQPKAKELLDYLLAAVMPVLTKDGSVWLVGDNKSGVKSSYKKLTNYLKNVGKVDSARHCLLYSGNDQLGNNTFCFDDWVKSWDQDVAGKSLTLVSIPGVFGHGKIDSGTRILLEHLDTHRFMSDANRARMLDFGCGDGIISLWITLHTGANVVALDDNALALKATELTFEANNLNDRLTIIGSNGLQNVQGRFNYVFTNPPFHTGVRTDYTIAEDFFIKVKQHLTLNGELFVVANDFLRYPALIDASLGSHERVTKQQGFAVYYSRHKKP